MEEFTNLIAIGVIGAVVLVIGIIVRLIVRPKGGKKKGKEKTGKEVNYKDAASVAMADGDASFKDGNLYDMKEGKEGTFKDGEKAKKDDGKMESWKDYE